MATIMRGSRPTASPSVTNTAPRPVSGLALEARYPSIWVASTAESPVTAGERSSACTVPGAATTVVSAAGCAGGSESWITGAASPAAVSSGATSVSSPAARVGRVRRGGLLGVARGQARLEPDQRLLLHLQAVLEAPQVAPLVEAEPLGGGARLGELRRGVVDAVARLLELLRRGGAGRGHGQRHRADRGGEARSMRADAGRGGGDEPSPIVSAWVPRPLRDPLGPPGPPCPAC